MTSDTSEHGHNQADTCDNHVSVQCRGRGSEPRGVHQAFPPVSENANSSRRLALLRTKYQHWRESEYRYRKLVVWLNYHLVKKRRWDAVFHLETKDRFTEIYRHNLWNNEESRSGGGSTIRNTTEIRALLPALLSELGVASIVDAGGGDFNWMRTLNLEVTHLGVDIVPDVILNNQLRCGTDRIGFRQFDITTAVLPKADLILCRDCLFHLSYADIASSLEKFRQSGATYLLATHCPDQPVNDMDIPSGWYRAVNLQREPFNLPQPIRTITEPRWNRSVALWRLDDLQAARGDETPTS